jgi:glutathione S-transferase
MANLLYIGNKNYSSWSLRPWLVLRWAKIPFEERLIRLDQPGYGRQGIEEVLEVSPNGRVPCLHADDSVIWDSLAIAEWAAESRPAAALWPADKKKRSEARSATAEMHAGFANVRNDLPMNIRGRVKPQDWRPETRAEIVRLDALWKNLRERHAGDGPFLFGARTIADAFYAPVATRMRTYAVALSAPSQAWCEAIFADPDFRDWEGESAPNSWDASGLSVIDRKYA